MDAYSKYETLVSGYRDDRGSEDGSRPFYDRQGVPLLDYGLLELLISKSLADGDSARSGGLARGLDMWIAEELRAAGFGEEEVWPRQWS